MPIHFRCVCGVVLSVADDHGGEPGECPGCGKILVSPTGSPAIQPIALPAEYGQPAPAAAVMEPPPEEAAVAVMEPPPEEELPAVAEPPGGEEGISDFEKKLLADAEVAESGVRPAASEPIESWQEEEPAEFQVEQAAAEGGLAAFIDGESEEAQDVPEPAPDVPFTDPFVQPAESEPVADEIYEEPPEISEEPAPVDEPVGSDVNLLEVFADDSEPAAIVEDEPGDPAGPAVEEFPEGDLQFADTPAEVDLPVEEAPPSEPARRRARRRASVEDEAAPPPIAEPSHEPARVVEFAKPRRSKKKTGTKARRRDEDDGESGRKDKGPRRRRREEEEEEEEEEEAPRKVGFFRKFVGFLLLLVILAGGALTVHALHYKIPGLDHEKVRPILDPAIQEIRGIPGWIRGVVGKIVGKDDAAGAGSDDGSGGNGAEPDAGAGGGAANPGAGEGAADPAAGAGGGGAAPAGNGGGN